MKQIIIVEKDKHTSDHEDIYIHQREKMLQNFSHNKWQKYGDHTQDILSWSYIIIHDHFLCNIFYHFLRYLSQILMRYTYIVHSKIKKKNKISTSKTCIKSFSEVKANPSTNDRNMKIFIFLIDTSISRISNSAI